MFALEMAWGTDVIWDSSMFASCFTDMLSMFETSEKEKQTFQKKVPANCFSRLLSWASARSSTNTRLYTQTCMHKHERACMHIYIYISWRTRALNRPASKNVFELIQWLNFLLWGWAGAWTIWPPEDPSHLHHAVLVILCLCKLADELLAGWRKSVSGLLINNCLLIWKLFFIYIVSCSGIVLFFIHGCALFLLIPTVVTFCVDIY